MIHINKHNYLIHEFCSKCLFVTIIPGPTLSMLRYFNLQFPGDIFYSGHHYKQSSPPRGQGHTALSLHQEQVKDSPSTLSQTEIIPRGIYSCEAFTIQRYSVECQVNRQFLLDQNTLVHREEFTKSFHAKKNDYIIHKKKQIKRLNCKYLKLKLV